MALFGSVEHTGTKCSQAVRLGKIGIVFRDSHRACMQVRKTESLPVDTKKSDKISLVQTAELLSEDIETLKHEVTKNEIHDLTILK